MPLPALHEVGLQGRRWRRGYVLAAVGADVALGPAPLHFLGKPRVRYARGDGEHADAKEAYPPRYRRAGAWAGGAAGANWKA